MPVLPHGTTRLPLNWFSCSLILFILRKCVEETEVSLKSDKNNGYYTWRPVYIFYRSRWILRMRNVSDKNCRENQNTNFVFNKFFFFIRVVCGITWKNIVEPGRPQMTVWHLRNACWMSKTTSTHSEYVILIAVPLQQLLHERTSMLRYTYVHCLPCVFCQCLYTFSIFCMLAPFIILFRVQVFNWPSPQHLPHPPSHAPHRSGSSRFCVNPAPCAVPLTDDYFVWQLLIVLRLFMFLGTVCVCVDSINCPFEFTCCVFFNLLLRMYVAFLFDEVCGFRDVFLRTNWELPTSTIQYMGTGGSIAREGRTVSSVGQTANLFHQIPGCRLHRLTKLIFFFFSVFALLVLVTRMSSFKWQLMSVI